MPLEAPYDQALREIPGVRSYRVLKVPPARRDRRVDGRLELRTEAGRSAFSYQVFRSHLDHKLTDHIVAAAEGFPESLLILAPHVGAGLSHELMAARLNYLDNRGAETAGAGGTRNGDQESVKPARRLRPL
jgi:hypothetical protein